MGGTDLDPPGSEVDARTPSRTTMVKPPTCLVKRSRSARSRSGCASPMLSPSREATTLVRVLSWSVGHGPPVDEPPTDVHPIDVSQHAEPPSPWRSITLCACARSHRTLRRPEHRAPSTPVRSGRRAGRDWARDGRPSAGDVDQVVLDVVQVVASQRDHREHRPVAAPAGAVPLRARHRAVELGRRRRPRRPARRPRWPGPGRRTRRRPPPGPGPSRRRSGRPWRASPDPPAKTRCTSRTWQAYSTDDQTPGAGRTAAPGSASTPRQALALA